MERSHTYYVGDGVRRTMIVDEERPYSPIVKTEVDLTSTLESIKRDRDNHRGRTINKLVARAPMTVYEQSVREGWDENDWRKWLNDPDNAAFRIWQGRV